MRRRPALAAGVLLASLAGASCANSAVRAAQSGDLAKLRFEIAGKHARGALSNGEAACLARAVAIRELITAKDEASATSRIRDAQGCVAELDDALEQRMKTHDGAGAEAALILLEEGRLSEGHARDYLPDADDRWRAVGTRTLHRDEDRKRRQAAVLDPSPRVRRSAIRAADQAEDVGDLEILLETARVDPEPILRNEAIRAMSHVLRRDGSKVRAGSHATRLRDLWTAGDDAIREDIAVAWALAPVFENGGREALRLEIATGQGPGSIAAAAVVLRTAPRDAELASLATWLLARTVAEGSRRDRLHAIASARSSGAELEALRTAAKDDDRDIRGAALTRLLESKADHDSAVRDLEAIAGQGVRAGSIPDDARTLEAVSRARLALAYAGDLRIQAWIELDLAAPEPHRRLAAASALAALGRPSRAVMLLTDPDPSVRTRAACTMLVAARR